MVRGNPFQYSQSAPFARVRKLHWGLNFLLRNLLSKKFPRLFHAQIFGLVQDSRLSYSEVLRRAHATTRRLWAGSAIVIAATATLYRALARGGV